MLPFLSDSCSYSTIVCLADCLYSVHEWGAVWIKPVPGDFARLTPERKETQHLDPKKAKTAVDAAAALEKRYS